MNKEALKTKVETALQEIRPYLEADGGNISLIDISDDTVSVQLERSMFRLFCKSNDIKKRCGSYHKKTCPSN